MNFPVPTTISNFGLLIILAILIFWFIVFFVAEKFSKHEYKLSWASVLFIALMSTMISIFVIEDYLGRIYYLRIGNHITMITRDILLIAFVWGLYTFFATWVWAYYKFTVKKEITPFMWEIIEFAESVKKETKL